MAQKTVEAAGRRVDEWEAIPDRDNHWFDCLVGCAAAAAIQGARLESVGGQARRESRRVSFAEAQRNKRSSAGGAFWSLAPPEGREPPAPPADAITRRSVKRTSGSPRLTQFKATASALWVVAPRWVACLCRSSGSAERRLRTATNGAALGGRPVRAAARNYGLSLAALACPVKVPEARSAGCGQRPTGAVTAVPRG